MSENTEVETLFQYQVAAGKHQMPDGSFARKGDIVSITKEYAEKFVNKFKAILEQVEAEAEAEAEAKAVEAVVKAVTKA